MEQRTTMNGALTNSSESRVALLLFGVSSGSYTGAAGQGSVMHMDRTWATQCAQSLKMHLVGPILRAGHTVDVFLSSAAPKATDPDALRTDELLALYHPHLRGWHLTEAAISTRAEKFSIALQLLCNFSLSLVTDQHRVRTRSCARSPLSHLEHTHAHVIISRPDLRWKRAVSVENLIRRDRLVFPHPCEDEAWLHWQCVSDMVISLPAAWLRTLLARCSAWVFSGNISLADYNLLPSRFEQIWGDRNLTSWHAQRGDRVPNWLQTSAHMAYRCALQQAFPDNSLLSFLLSERHRCNANSRVFSPCSKDAPFELGPLTSERKVYTFGTGRTQRIFVLVDRDAPG